VTVADAEVVVAVVEQAPEHADVVLVRAADLQS
jgi:hypothetical protein